MIHLSEPLVKPFLEFQKIFLKNRQNCKKCNKIAIKTQKFAKNYKKIAKNDNETLKIYCNLTPLVVGNLRSIQHIWYLPKNGPKIAKKWQKRPKNRKNCQKRVILYNKIGPLERIVLAFFPTHVLGLSERYVLDPQTIIGDSVFMEI